MENQRKYKRYSVNIGGSLFDLLYDILDMENQRKVERYSVNIGGYNTK